MSGRSHLIAALAVLGAAMAAPAFAQQLTITYSGTVTYLDDPSGLFGAPTTNGTADFTDTYVFDLAGGMRVTGGGFDQLLGGSAFGAPSPLVSSTLTINGVSESFPGGYGDQAFYQPGQFVQANSNEYNSGPNGWVYEYISMSTTNTPSSLESPFSGTGSGSGSFMVCDPANCNVNTEAFGGEFNPTSVVAVVSGAVPEPATWAMMILGMGLIGYAARRRNVGLAFPA